MCKQNVQPIAAPGHSVASVVTDLCDSDSDSDSDCETIALHRPSLVAGNQWKGVPRSLPSLAWVAKSMSKVTPGDAVLGSASGLVQLRTENSRLREALEQAQQNAESQAIGAKDDTGANAGDRNPVDFAHLLELVKELGYGLGSFAAVDEEPFLEGNQVADETYGAISISTPRDEKCFASEGELAELREELDDSREENNDLRVALSASEAQVAAMHMSVEIGHRSSSLRQELLESKNEIAKLKAALWAKEAEVVELQFSNVVQ